MKQETRDYLVFLCLVISIAALLGVVALAYVQDANNKMLLGEITLLKDDSPDLWAEVDEMPPLADTEKENTSGVNLPSNEEIVTLGLA